MNANESWKNLTDKARKGVPEAEWEVGAKYDEGVIVNNKLFLRPDPQKAFFWYKQAAKHGNSSGQLCLGYCYDIGNGVKQDKNKALHWYKKALRSGEAIAASNIGSIYKEFSNNRRAFFWYKRAVEIGDDDALIDLGIMYYKGIGVRKNYKLSIESFEKAMYSNDITEAGRRDSMYYLGIAYFEGKGVIENIPKALKLFKQANLDDDHLLAKKMLNHLK